MGSSQLNSWEQEFVQIKNDLVTAEEILLRGQEASSRNRTRLISQIARFHGTIIANFEKIIYMASPKPNLRASERSLLHWAADFSEKALTFSDKVSNDTVISMWAKLIHARVSGNKTKASEMFGTYALSKSKLTGYRKRFARIEREMEDKLKSIEEEKDSLTNRYNMLVLTRSNRDASGSMSEVFGRKLSEALKHPSFEALERLLLNGSLRIRKQHFSNYSTDLKKINRLVAHPVKSLQAGNDVDQMFSESMSDGYAEGRSRDSSRGTSHSIERDADEYFSSFDVLSQKIMEMGSSKKHIQRRLITAQVEKSNKLASGINLCLDGTSNFDGESRVSDVERLVSDKP